MKKITTGKSKGFTLAEVLITLGIIGVVAAFTIPVLMHDIQDNQFKVAYKKAFSVLSQAIQKANADYVLESPTGSYDVAHLDNFKTLMSYLKTQKTCYDRIDNSGCWYKDGEEFNSSSFSNGYPDLRDLAAIDISGMSWATYAHGYDSSIFVDTNGLKAPNQFGKDRFYFSLRIDNSGGTDNGRYTGICHVVLPSPDNIIFACNYNKCATTKDYFPQKWLYN